MQIPCRSAANKGRAAISKGAGEIFIPVGIDSLAIGHEAAAPPRRAIAPAASASARAPSWPGWLALLDGSRGRPAPAADWARSGFAAEASVEMALARCAAPPPMLDEHPYAIITQPPFPRLAFKRAARLIGRPRHPGSENDVQDILWIAALAGLVAVTLAYVRLCDAA